MTSLLQIEANRCNATKSTGPKTTAGKLRSRRNARHGLSAETVIGIVEDIEDYKGFEAAIIADNDSRTNRNHAAIYSRRNHCIDQRHWILVFDFNPEKTPKIARKASLNCEDYAIVKFVALREAGVPADDLRIVVMRETIRGEDHAVAAARLDGHWLMLDNIRMAMIEDGYVRNFRPLS